MSGLKLQRMGALLNVIPYIGGILAVTLFMTVALVNKSSAWFAMYVFGIQIIDNNYIVLKIVASKVKINTLFSIIVVFVGNALCRIPDIILYLPLLAIVKVIFDHIELTKTWGYLLGDAMSKIKLRILVFKKIKWESPLIISLWSLTVGFPKGGLKDQVSIIVERIFGTI